MVKRSIDQKLRLRNFDARHGRIEPGAVIKSRKGLSGVQGGKGTCHQWKEKGQCSKGDQCSFRNESNDRAQKPDHNAATPSEPSLSRGRSVSMKRSIRGKSNHGSILRQPCRYYLKKTCTRTSCEYGISPSVTSLRIKRVVRLETSVCFRITRLVNNQKKDEKEEPLPKKKRKRRQEYCGYCEKCITIGLCITRFRCTRFSRLKVSVKPDAKSLGTNSKGTIHQVYVASCEYPGKGRTIVGKNKCQSSSSAKSRRFEI